MTTTDTTSQQQNVSAEPKTLGLTRWVQVAYMAIGLLLFFLLDKIVTLVWGNFAEPNPTLSAAASAVVAAVVVWRAYRHEKLNRLSHEVVAELSKVTWPSNTETRTSTVVVIITSLIAAAVLGVFDTVWSAVTDLIYRV